MIGATAHHTRPRLKPPQTPLIASLARQPLLYGVSLLSSLLPIHRLPRPALRRSIPFPVIHSTSFMKTILIPVDLGQRLLDTDIQNRIRRMSAVTIEKAHVLVQNQVRLGHQPIRLRHKRRLGSMSIAKVVKLFVCDHELAHVAQRLVRVVLAGDHEDLETFPAKGLEGGNLRIHVFGHIEFADDGVEFEFDAVCATPVGDLVEFVHLVAGAAADGDVGWFVERVA